MARAATSPELTYLRSDGQMTRLGLAVYNPASVMTATISATPAALDEIKQVSISIATGSYTAVQDGMTVLVGSAAGLSDVGIARATACTSTLLSIGEASDINFASGQYITVLPDWLIWSRKLAFNAGVWNIEGDIAFTDQYTSPDPVPVLGPIAAVLRLTGSTVSFSPTAAASWVIGGSITAYAWSAPGASATSGLTTTTPTLTYYAVGSYRIDCTLTANGKTYTGHRYVIVVDDNGGGMSTQFAVKNLTGDMSAGGWAFDVTMYAGADYASIRDRAFLVLFARDWYGGTETNIGPITGYENVIACGWIEGETIHMNPEQGSAQFTVSGPAAWMAKVSSWPISVMDTDTASADWMHINGLTIDKAIWHLTHWRSTVDKIIDVIPSYDTRRAFDCSAGAGSLWEQLKTFSDIKIGATPGVDRYGRLIVQIDLQLLPLTTRSTLPVVMAITKGDWFWAIDLQKKLPTCALLETGGFAYVGGAWAPMLARAAGNAMGRFGSGLVSRYNLEFADQATANALTAAIYAKMNNPFPSVPIDLAQNNRLIDIVPQQYVTLTIGAGDTPRGIVWTNKRLIPRRVEFTFADGMLRTSLDCEGETVPGLSVTVLPPATPTIIDPVTPGFPSFPAFPGLPGATINPIGDDCAGNMYASGNGPFRIAFVPNALHAGESSTARFPCSLRKGESFYPSRLYMDGVVFTPDARANYRVDAIDSGGSVLVAGTLIGAGASQIWEFAPLSPVNVAGFKISLAAGGGDVYTPGDIISTGSADGNYQDGITISGLTIGQLYSIEATGGPFYMRTDLTNLPCYNFAISNEGSGRFVYSMGFSSYTGNFELNVPSWALYGERIGATNYARCYWEATTTSILFKVGDSMCYDNPSNPLGYILRHAVAPSNRYMTINPCSLYNVCDAI